MKLPRTAPVDCGPKDSYITPLPPTPLNRQKYGHSVIEDNPRFFLSFLSPSSRFSCAMQTVVRWPLFFAMTKRELRTEGLVARFRTVRPFFGFVYGCAGCCWLIERQRQITVATQDIRSEQNTSLYSSGPAIVSINVPVLRRD